MANEDNQISESVTEWVTFHLLDEKYAVNVTHVREVLKNTKISPVPGAPYFVQGIINLRGNIVTVINTHSRLSLAASEHTDATRIVVVDMGGQVVGMMVDKADEVVILKESEIDYAPSVGNDDSSNFIHGVSQREEELLILVDLDKMLGLEQYSA